MKELLKKLRKYQIQIRKAVNSRLQGNFHSIFKGTGLEFDDVRPYQYGDDIRSIDWNVSAKGHGTYIKTYKEEKEQTIYFILDVSASQNIGTPGKTKADIGKEICGVLTLSGAQESSLIGLICFSDKREKFIKPKKSMQQAYEIITTLIKLNPQSLQTSLSKAISFALNYIKKRSVIIFISDFIDENYQHSLKSLAQRHDLVMIKISDNRESQMPKLGIIPVKDTETQKTIWVNTSFGGFRESIVSYHENNERELMSFCRKHQINFIAVDTHEDYVPKLLKLFKVRNKSIQRV